MHYEPASANSVRCLLCPHACEIPKGQTGKCGSRKNNGGKLIAESFAVVNSIALDPIEKKPLHFFHPGSAILSVGTYGCNLDCPFCQNHKSVRRFFEMNDAKQAEIRANNRIPPPELAAIAQKYAIQGNIGVAYTYNEPIVGYEYVYECAKLVYGAGLKNILVTNGFINPKPLNELLRFVDAMNIDLKGFSQNFYDKLDGKLEAVMNNITIAAKSCHVEVTILVIPGENDRDIDAAAKWLASISPEIPLHLSRFFPLHKYAGRLPTPIDTLHEAAQTAKKYLKNVVIGNVR